MFIGLLLVDMLELILKDDDSNAADRFYTYILPDFWLMLLSITLDVNNSTSVSDH